jgi:hypothetical protein
LIPGHRQSSTISRHEALLDFSTEAAMVAVQTATSATVAELHENTPDA